METKKNKIHFLPSVIIFALIVLLVWLLFGRATASMDTDGGQTLETALENSAVLCYSLEGFYPPSLDYLTENYGVVVDQEHYIVHYDAFASNMMPDIRVVPK
ncbi:hypothetical protein [Eubacterium sp. 1001713B170207_170306_E7]|uniref:hypothetical protein n=1 Tax=Eubacterium sp. 1001713B170207_170306_E7 TaxID=2787097 RepID=UPI00189748AE|nr:hypothetical protein [Eubacterium sp. 1001713B170207_170306_E7]